MEWRYNFHIVSIAATAIVCYVWIVPLALWAALKWTITPDGHDEIETQVKHTSVTMLSHKVAYENVLCDIYTVTVAKSGNI